MENIIKIKGGSYSDVKKAVRQWIKLYSDNLDKSLTFELYKNGKGNHLIKIDDRLDNENFFYLINYLKYPENIDYNINIDGYTIGKEYKEFQNQNILVYIAKNDTEYDTVNVVTEKKKTFKVNFGGKINEVSDDFYYSPLNIPDLANPEIIKINKSIKKDQVKEETSGQIEKRFKIISLIVLLAYVLNLLVPDFTTGLEIFEKTTWGIFMGVGVWFLSDYEMLRINSYYIKSMFIALLVLIYGLIVIKQLYSDVSELTLACSLYPITLLIVQWPTRRIYKFLFKREPKVDQHGKFTDLIYTVILFMGFALLPFLITDWIK